MDAEIAAILRKLIRVGTVVNSPGNGKVRVVFPDYDNSVSWKLQTTHKNTHKNKDYHAYDHNEQVLCLFLGNGTSSGFVLGALYNDKDEPPEGVNIDKRHIVFDDGTWIEYDRATHEFKAEIKGTAEIKVEKTLDAEVGETVKIKAGGDITAETDANMTLKAAGDLSIEAGGDLSLESGGDLSLKASGNFTLSAANATVNAAGQWASQAGINSDTHKHSGVQSGPATTGAAVP